ncbi:Flp family type IVb pilin [Gimesia benthica]|uniref:Flp family type IVb pilin n=1 Tax=Gimesia benthica TaxID=2608982 RepID=A0A6I6A840_9PLAN|nr:Flp family type IVb pilin [Gimesia benthica]QGQ22584.1 Flp family type IVb pilin [Gimesia benthica]
MSRCIKQFWNDEGGFVLSAELVIILTVAVLAMIVGLTYVQSAVITEFNDIGNALSSLNQTYAYSGFQSWSYFGKYKAFYAGSAYGTSPRGAAMLGYNGAACNYGNQTYGGSYSQDIPLQQETVEQPCEICRPDEVIEEPAVDCPHCQPGEPMLAPEPEPRVVAPPKN